MESHSGRSPLVVGFWTTSVSGSPLWMISAPAEGCRLAGAVMFTPGMGPATEGLSGLALLACWHAADSSARPAAIATESTERIETSPYRAIG
jgi:hypothetical protein